MAAFGTKAEQYERKINTLKKELEILEQKHKKAIEIATPEDLLDKMYNDERYTSLIARATLETCDGNAAKAASLLSTSVSDLYKSCKNENTEN